MNFTLFKETVTLAVSFGMKNAVASFSSEDALAIATSGVPVDPNPPEKWPKLSASLEARNAVIEPPYRKSQKNSEILMLADDDIDA